MVKERRQDDSFSGLADPSARLVPKKAAFLGKGRWDDLAEGEEEIRRGKE